MRHYIARQEKMVPSEHLSTQCNAHLSVGLQIFQLGAPVLSLPLSPEIVLAGRVQHTPDVVQDEGEVHCTAHDFFHQ